MKKVIICGILSLFIGGIANASTEVNAHKSTLLSTTSLEIETEIIGSGVDAGGFYVILSTDTQCVKVYVSDSGMFDH